jgi:hypothetical protein
MTGNQREGIVRFYYDILENIQPIINYLNLSVSLIALFFIAFQRKVDHKIRHLEDFKRLAELSCNKNELNTYAENIHIKVAKLVNLFRVHIALFSLSLFAVYLVILNTPESGEEVVTGYRILTNLVNLTNALFVSLAFCVLYVRTVRDPNVDNESDKLRSARYFTNLYWTIPLSFFVIYTLYFLLKAIPLITLPVGQGLPREALWMMNRFDLFVGLANGLTMTLLFGKYVSIERSISETKNYDNVFKNLFYPFSRIKYRAVVSFSIIFILPIYALAQPLFGSFKITAFGDAKQFQTVVYGACLVGKCFFLHLTYILLSKKLLHLYFYGVVSQIGNFRKLEECFDPEIKPGNRVSKAENSVAEKY